MKTKKKSIQETTKSDIDSDEEYKRFEHSDSHEIGEFLFRLAEHVKRENGLTLVAVSRANIVKFVQRLTTFFLDCR